jgi:hypothetical protein
MHDGARNRVNSVDETALVGEAVRAGQHHPRPPREPLRRGRSAGLLLQPATFVLSQQHRFVVAFSRHVAQRTSAATGVQDFF